MSQDPKAPIERTSLNGGLEAMYAKSSGEFKKAGTKGNVAKSTSKYETDFQGDGTALTEKALDYADTIRVTNTPYAPSGRRE